MNHPASNNNNTSMCILLNSFVSENILLRNHAEDVIIVPDNAFVHQSRRRSVLSSSSQCSGISGSSHQSLSGSCSYRRRLRRKFSSDKQVKSKSRPRKEEEDDDEDSITLKKSLSLQCRWHGKACTSESCGKTGASTATHHSCSSSSSTSTTEEAAHKHTSSSCCNSSKPLKKPMRKKQPLRRSRSSEEDFVCSKPLRKPVRRTYSDELSILSEAVAALAEDQQLMSASCHT